jgi:hypothetical protein
LTFMFECAFIIFFTVARGYAFFPRAMEGVLTETMLLVRHVARAAFLSTTRHASHGRWCLSRHCPATREVWVSQSVGRSDEYLGVLMNRANFQCMRQIAQYGQPHHQKVELLGRHTAIEGPFGDNNSCQRIKRSAPAVPYRLRWLLFCKDAW